MRRLLLLVAVLAAGCSSSSSKQAAPSPTPTPSPTVSAAPAPSDSPRPHCGNAESGGACLGDLAPGHYDSAGFAVQLGVTVPAGWSNQEDINGRYLLLPKGATRTGADAGTSDYVGVYDPVVASDPSCADVDLGAEQKAATLAATLAKRPGIVATRPAPVRLGALSGTVLDLRMAAGWTKTCPDGDPPFPIVPVISGGRPPELIAHDLTKGVVVRLYLLDSDFGTVAVQVQDAAGGSSLAALDVVARSIAFAP
jgi:hypothetical protein